MSSKLSEIERFSKSVPMQTKLLEQELNSSLPALEEACRSPLDHGRDLSPLQQKQIDACFELICGCFSRLPLFPTEEESGAAALRLSHFVERFDPVFRRSAIERCFFRSVITDFDRETLRLNGRVLPLPQLADVANSCWQRCAQLQRYREAWLKAGDLNAHMNFTAYDVFPRARKEAEIQLFLSGSMDDQTVRDAKRFLEGVYLEASLDYLHYLRMRLGGDAPAAGKVSLNATLHAHYGSVKRKVEDYLSNVATVFNCVPDEDQSQAAQQSLCFGKEWQPLLEAIAQSAEGKEYQGVLEQLKAWIVYCEGIAVARRARVPQEELSQAIRLVENCFPNEEARLEMERWLSEDTPAPPQHSNGNGLTTVVDEPDSEEEAFQEALQSVRASFADYTKCLLGDPRISKMTAKLTASFNGFSEAYLEVKQRVADIKASTKKEENLFELVEKFIERLIQLQMATDQIPSIPDHGRARFSMHLQRAILSLLNHFRIGCSSLGAGVVERKDVDGRVEEVINAINYASTSIKEGNEEIISMYFDVLTAKFCEIKCEIDVDFNEQKLANSSYRVILEKVLSHLCEKQSRSIAFRQSPIHTDLQVSHPENGIISDIRQRLAEKEGLPKEEQSLTDKQSPIHIGLQVSHPENGIISNIYQCLAEKEGLPKEEQILTEEERKQLYALFEAHFGKENWLKKLEEANPKGFGKNSLDTYYRALTFAVACKLREELPVFSEV